MNFLILPQGYFKTELANEPNVEVEENEPNPQRD
jgi:hypothetical protein